MNTTIYWKTRELSRFGDGTYKPVPVPLDYPADHFLHLSVTDTEPEMVAYTASEQHGESDRQTRLKFGRYLKKTFPALTDSEIQAHVIALKSALAVANAPVTLHFATDRETITRIFETPMCAWGSEKLSCMYNKFTGDIRPYHVYADSPDVAVAYVMTADEIVSRSVVSTKDKTWIRCYSIESGNNDADCGTLRALLKEAGYVKGELYGNRLTKLRTSRVMLPYMDNGECGVESDGKYWIVVKEGEGEYDANLIDGTGEPYGRCSTCDRLEDDCECSYCNCCERRFVDDCDNCRMCQHCDCCIEHGVCSCARCSECGELIERYRYYTHCECDRCSNCNELVDECGCDKCDVCGLLSDNCECEHAENDNDTSEDYTPLVLTHRQIKEKLDRIWRYLRDQGYSYQSPSGAMIIVERAYDSIEVQDGALLHD